MHPNYQNERINKCMDSKNQLFNIIEPKNQLKKSVIGKIKALEMKKTINNVVFSSLISLASIASIVFFIINIINDASKSGLSQYLSLIFSDGKLIASYWQTYVLSVVESLPIIPIAIVVASFSIFVWSLNKFLENIRNTKSVFYKIN